MRLIGVVALVSTALLLTSGCTVEVGGSVGLTKDAQGRLLAVVVVCHGYIDGLTMYRDDTENSDAHSNDRGRWMNESPIKRDTTLDLVGPGLGWKTVVPLAVLTPGQEVRIYGWTNKSRWSADGPAFQVSDLARLDSEHILSALSDPNELVPRAEFRALACG